MAIKDVKLLPNSHVAEHLIPVGITTATSQTALPFFVFQPGWWFKFAGLGVGCRAEAGAVTITARIVEGDGAVSNPNLRIDASEPEDYELDAFAYAINGVLYNKALVDGGDFSAAHVVTALKFGIILLQIDTSGTITSKVPAATPTTAMAFATYDEAVRNLPAPDANKAPVGYIVIEADSGNWTANTDDMTPGGDCEDSTFVSGPFAYYGDTKPVLNPMDAAVAAVGGTYVEGVIADDAAELVGSPDALLVLTYTSDGTGALTAGTAMARIRPYPLNGQSIPGGYDA